MKMVLMSIWTWTAMACSVALLAACGSASTGTAAPGGPGGPAGGGDRLQLVTSFYPLRPVIARTVAAETGARTAVLDPIEGITTASRGRDYLEVMSADLAALEAGQPCP
jgi:ABC-type Zn uptake system ZnuABC Zn-binding protein ZnuA